MLNYLYIISSFLYKNSLIVDDASKDKSIKIINEFIKTDKRIKLIKNKINRGSLYARYKGASLAKGKYIIFVDSDDIINYHIDFCQF